MQYKISWVDATLNENWKSLKSFYNSLGVVLKIIKDEGAGGWVDYMAVKEFEAKDDKEAKSVLKALLDDNDRIEIFNLQRGDEVVLTEEDYFELYN